MGQMDPETTRFWRLYEGKKMTLIILKFVLKSFWVLTFLFGVIVAIIFFFLYRLS